MKLKFDEPLPNVAFNFNCVRPAARGEMDSEAEEREGELKIAYEHIKQLQEALREAGGKV